MCYTRHRSCLSLSFVIRGIDFFSLECGIKNCLRLIFQNSLGQGIQILHSEKHCTCKNSLGQGILILHCEKYYKCKADPFLNYDLFDLI